MRVEKGEEKAERGGGEWRGGRGERSYKEEGRDYQKVGCREGKEDKEFDRGKGRRLSKEEDRLSRSR